MGQLALAEAPQARLPLARARRRPKGRVATPAVAAAVWFPFVWTHRGRPCCHLRVYWQRHVAGQSASRSALPNI